MNIGHLSVVKVFRTVCFMENTIFHNKYNLTAVGYLQNTKIMKSFLLLLILSITAISSICAQTIKIRILDNSIRFKEDTILFKIRIINNSRRAYSFYNINSAGIELYDYYNKKTQNNFKNDNFNPGLSLFFKTAQGKHCRSLRQALTSGFGFDENNTPFTITYTRPDKNSQNCGTYHIIQANDSADFEIEKSLFQLDLKTGKYQLQMVYIANNYYLSDFTKAQENNSKLNNTILFKGLLKAQKIWFNYKSVPSNYPNYPYSQGVIIK